MNDNATNYLSKVIYNKVKKKFRNFTLITSLKVSSIARVFDKGGALPDISFGAKGFGGTI